MQVRQKIEQWIAWFRNQNFVVGVAKQAENKRVRFAGAGGQKNRFEGERGAVILEIVARRFLPGGQQTFRLRIIGKRLWIVNRGKNGLWVVVQAASRGVRDRK